MKGGRFGWRGSVSLRVVPALSVQTWYTDSFRMGTRVTVMRQSVVWNPRKPREFGIENRVRAW